jgi:hypothetical protein
MNQARFQKQQREKARREKAAAKWARREERRNTPDEAQPTTPPADQAQLLAQLADLHARFDAGTITFDDFTAAKDDLTRQLSVD